jgi:hypothetical protein
MKLLPAVITADQIAFTAVENGEPFTITYVSDGLIDSLDAIAIEALNSGFLDIASKHFTAPDDRTIYFDVDGGVAVDEAFAKKEYDDEGVFIPIGKDAPKDADASPADVVEIEEDSEVNIETTVEEGIKP